MSITKYKPLAPSLTLLWEAVIDVGEGQELGVGPTGPRRMVPILGGTFRGGPDYPDLQGQVLPGGADRQVRRLDGARELDALYEMRAQDGSIMTVRNRVLIDQPAEGTRYAVSHLVVTAPEGRWAWLNKRVILGTMQSAKPERSAVVIWAWATQTA